MRGHPKAKGEMRLVADGMLFADLCDHLFAFIWWLACSSSYSNTFNTYDRCLTEASVSVSFVGLLLAKLLNCIWQFKCHQCFELFANPQKVKYIYSEMEELNAWKIWLHLFITYILYFLSITSNNGYEKHDKSSRAGGKATESIQKYFLEVLKQKFRVPLDFHQNNMSLNNLQPLKITIITEYIWPVPFCIMTLICLFEFFHCNSLLCQTVLSWKAHLNREESAAHPWHLPCPHVIVVLEIQGVPGLSIFVMFHFLHIHSWCNRNVIIRHPDFTSP